MSREATLGNTAAVLESVVFAVPAELGHEFATPAEACRTDREILSLGLLERLDEAEDPGSGDCWTTNEQPWDEDVCGPNDVANF